MYKTVPIDDPRKAAHADEWDSITVEALMNKKMMTKSE